LLFNIPQISITGASGAYSLIFSLKVIYLLTEFPYLSEKEVLERKGEQFFSEKEVEDVSKLFDQINPKFKEESEEKEK
jgi:hypothetical protein